MIVIQPSEGRLGNQLQRLAHILAFAEEEKVNVYNIAVCETSSSFMGLKGNLFGRYPAVDVHLPVTRYCRRSLTKFMGTLTFKRLSRVSGFPQYNCWANTYESRVYLEGNPVIKAQSLQGAVHLYGHYYYCHALVKKHAPILRRYFELVPREGQALARRMAGHRLDHPVIIGVHMRKSDYKAYLNSDYCFDDAIYVAAMKKVQQLWAPLDPLFLLCSDVPVDRGRYSAFRHVIPGESAVADMYALSQCDAIMGPKSTFTAWSSFFGSVPRYVMKQGATQPERREDFWICDDLRGGVTAGEKID